MNAIAEYLQKNVNLSSRVNSYSQSLNQNSSGLNELIQQLEYLFALIQRSDNLTKIIHDYSKNYRSSLAVFADDFTGQEKYVKEAKNKFLEISELLKSIDDRLTAIRGEVKEFVASSKSLTYLAKNAEIKSYQAAQEGRGLAVIARESLVIAQLARKPFQNFERLLHSLKDSAAPVVNQLEKIIQISHRSSALLANVQGTLLIIDEAVVSLQKIVSNIEAQNDIYSELKKSVSEEVRLLKDQLTASLRMIDDMSINCAELGALAQIANTLHGIIETNGRVRGSGYIARQFQYNIQENIRMLGKLSIGKRPTASLHKVYANINRSMQQIGELNRASADIALSSENLHAGMNEILKLESAIDSFYQEARQMMASINLLGDDLNRELGRVEETVATAGKVFAKIKTLAIFARIEETHCRNKKEVIAPVVKEFVDLALNTEKLYANINGLIAALRRDVRVLSRATVEEEYVVPTITDYSKIKIFLDDLIRILDGKIKAANNIVRIAGDLDSQNAQLSDLNKDYNESVSELIQRRAVLDRMLDRSSPAAPALIRQKVVLSSALGGNPLNIRPDLITEMNSYILVNNISTGLFQFGEGLEIVPGLCEDYQQSDDGREYTFRLKTGSKFHNGVRVAVDDVRNGLARALSGPNANLFRMVGGASDAAASGRTEKLQIRILDSHTLQVRLEYPFLPFLANLATNTADPFIEGPEMIGTGPFRIVSWDKGRMITLEASDLYFEGRPAVDEVKFFINNSDEVNFELFLKGDLSVYHPSIRTIKKIKQRFPETLCTVPKLMVQYVCINCRVAPFNNRLVRRAMAHAVNSRDLVRSHLEGNAIVARGVFPPGLPVYNPKLVGNEYNLQKSRDLMTDAGFGRGLPDTYPIDFNDSPSGFRLGEFIKSQLEKIGIKVELNPLPLDTFLEKSYNGLSILTIQGWVSANGDPDNFIYPLFHSSSAGSAGNRSFFASEEIDQEIEEARKIRNFNQRMLFYQNLEKKIVDEAPLIFLYHALENVAIQKNIMGLKPHPLGLIRMKSACRHD